MRRPLVDIVKMKLEPLELPLTAYLPKAYSALCLLTAGGGGSKGSTSTTPPHETSSYFKNHSLRSF